MYGNSIGDAFLSLFYVAAFGIGFIFAIAVIAAISIFAPVHLGVAFLSAHASRCWPASLTSQGLGLWLDPDPKRDHCKQPNDHDKASDDGGLLRLADLGASGRLGVVHRYVAPIGAPR